MNTILTFKELRVSQETLSALDSMGFKHPTEIQSKAIPPLMDGKSILGQARTGTGKTAAFAIPIVESKQRDHHHGHRIKSLVLTPTRELAVQVAEEIERIGSKTSIRCCPIYGGQSMDKQLRDLKRGVDVIVGTPGRIMDHVRRETMDLGGVEFFVLDEADRMLDMGFIEDIKWIMSRIPAKRQMALFSATLPPPIKELAGEYMPDALNIYVSHDDLTVPEIEQVYYSVGRVNKIWALTQVLDIENPSKALVFCSTKFMTTRVAQQLSRNGFSAAEIHGDLSQARREKALEGFKNGKIRFLVATDVAARGLDIDDVGIVINYDVPDEPAVYIHRIGRTGRAGKSGKAIMFVTAKEKASLQAIEYLIKKRVKKEEVPEKRGKKNVAGMRRLIDFDEICNPFGMVDFIMDAGSKDGLTVYDVVSLLSKVGKINESLVGDIRIREEDTIVQIHKSFALNALRKLSNFKHGETRISLRLVKER